MLRTRLILSSLAVVLAVSAVVSTSVWAATETFGGVQCQARPDGHGNWKDPNCKEPGVNGTYETQEITNGPVEGEGATAVLKTEIGTTKIYIGCQKTTLTGKFEKGGKSSATIKYTECKLYEEATGKVVTSCIVENITATALDELEGPKGAIEDKFTPKENEEFTKIKITGSSCVLKGTFEIKGSFKCELPSAESHVVEHEINCKESGSNLKFASKPMTFRGSIKVMLSSKDPWWFRRA